MLYRFRSAVAGRWVKRLFALLNPLSTVKERVRITKSSGCVWCDIAYHGEHPCRLGRGK